MQPDARDSSADPEVAESQAKARMETRDYVWKYWAFHADQRLKAFNFFILFVSVVVAGSIAYLKDAPTPAYIAPCGLLLVVLSWLFWRLDCRNRGFIKHAEGILKEIELQIDEQIVPDTQRLLISEESKTQKLTESISKLSFEAPLTFYDVFCWTFCLFAALGFLLFVASLALPRSEDAVPAATPVQQFIFGQYPVVSSPVQDRRFEGSPPARNENEAIEEEGVRGSKYRPTVVPNNKKQKADE